MSEEETTSGHITVNNFNLDSLREKDIPKLRRSMGIVFQDFRLIENMTVYENVEFAMRVTNRPTRGMRRRVFYVLDLVGIGYQTPKGDELDGDLFMIMRYVVECFYTEITTQSTFMNVQAMFIFGMAYQLERLGIKKMP